MQEIFDSALDNASLESYEGIYSSEELLKLIDSQQIIDGALELILAERK